MEVSAQTFIKTVKDCWGCVVGRVPRSHTMRKGSADLRQSLERRKKDQFEKFTQALADVSPTAFMQEDSLKASGCGICLDLQLSGAIPPITESRKADCAGMAAIALSERRAAEELIAKARQESLHANQALVSQARRYRGLRSRRQSLRPVSMQSTRTNSPFPPAHSPLSASTSDWEFSGLSPHSSDEPADSPIPMGKVFEEMLANYYRQAEELRDVEYAAVQQARRQETELAQQEHVRREHFEMQHRRREAAIIHELHRRERRRVFDESRNVLVVDRLAEERIKLKLEQQRRREAARQQRAQSSARRAKYESHFDFILSQGALERACSKVDRQKHRRSQTAETKMRVDNRKEKWQKHAGQLHARRVFLQEQKRVQDEDRDRQYRYHVARQMALREQESLDKKWNVQIHHVCANAIRDIKQEMSHSLHSQASQPQVNWSTSVSTPSVPSIVVDDLAKYQEALQAMSSLADEVQAQFPLHRPHSSRSSDGPDNVEDAADAAFHL